MTCGSLLGKIEAQTCFVVGVEITMFILEVDLSFTLEVLGEVEIFEVRSEDQYKKDFFSFCQNIFFLMCFII